MGLAVLFSLASGYGPSHTVEDVRSDRMTTVYIVLLRKGPHWNASHDATALQEAHLANIRSMWRAKKLIVAGPLGDDGDLRGIFLFQVPSLEDAKALTTSDPLVKEGHLVGEIHPWWVEKNALPEAGEYCRHPL
ncbi:MAG TPA: YciI family protein [Vicinamibacteria bacterium]|nr:YciI family protein [Vicinamibacteria bacterium]